MKKLVSMETAWWLFAALAQGIFFTASAQSQAPNSAENSRSFYHLVIPPGPGPLSPEAYPSLGTELHPPIIGGPSDTNFQKLQMAKYKVIDTYISERFSQIRDSLLRIDARIDHAIRSFKSHEKNPNLHEMHASVSATNALLATLSYRNSSPMQRQIRLQSLMAKASEILLQTQRLRGLDRGFHEDISKEVSGIRLRLAEVKALLERRILEDKLEEHIKFADTIPSVDFVTSEAGVEIRTEVNTVDKSLIENSDVKTVFLTLHAQTLTTTVTSINHRSADCKQPVVVTQVDTITAPIFAVTLTDVVTSSVTLTADVVTKTISLPGTTVTETVSQYSTTITEITLLERTETLPVETVTEMSTYFIAVSEIVNALGITDTIVLHDGLFSKSQSNQRSHLTSETITETVTKTRLVTFTGDKITPATITFTETMKPVEETVTVSSSECLCTSKTVAESFLEPSTMLTMDEVAITPTQSLEATPETAELFETVFPFETEPGLVADTTKLATESESIMNKKVPTPEATTMEDTKTEHEVFVTIVQKPTVYSTDEVYVVLIPSESSTVSSMQEFFTETISNTVHKIKETFKTAAGEALLNEEITRLPLDSSTNFLGTNSNEGSAIVSSSVISDTEPFFESPTELKVTVSDNDSVTTTSILSTTFGSSSSLDDTDVIEEHDDSHSGMIVSSSTERVEEDETNVTPGVEDVETSEESESVDLSDSVVADQVGAEEAAWGDSLESTTGGRLEGVIVNDLEELEAMLSVLTNKKQG